MSILRYFPILQHVVLFVSKVEDWVDKRYISITYDLHRHGTIDHARHGTLMLDMLEPYFVEDPKNGFHSRTSLVLVLLKRDIFGRYKQLPTDVVTVMIPFNYDGVYNFKLNTSYLGDITNKKLVFELGYLHHVSRTRRYSEEGKNFKNTRYESTFQIVATGDFLVTNDLNKAKNFGAVKKGKKVTKFGIPKLISHSVEEEIYENGA